MTPREYEAIVEGLREYREEEARLHREAAAQMTGQHQVGGEVIRNR
jgi:hypothetical protein